jgi:hypothetical protein
VAEVIPFPQRKETRTVHFEEKHAFGEIGGLHLSLVQEKGHEGNPFVLVLLGGSSGFQLIETFDPTTEGRESAKIIGDIILRALAAAHSAWTHSPID